MAAPLGEEAADRFAPALKVLADPARLRLWGIIGADPQGEVCVCNLTEPLGFVATDREPPLKVLTEAGLLSANSAVAGLPSGCAPGLSRCFVVLSSEEASIAPS